MAAAITQTITIVDKSNKVVSASKQLKNVFAEAKYAYQARKAEIKAERKRQEDRELRKAIRACSVAEDEVRSEGGAHRRRGSEHNGYDSRTQVPYSQQRRSGSNSPRQVSLGQFNEQLYGAGAGQTRSMPLAPNDPDQNLQRRHTDLNHTNTPQDLQTVPPPFNRSYSTSDVDLNLAYGEFHEPDLAPSNTSLPKSPQVSVIPVSQEKELSGLVMKCKKLLDEADCAGSSVKAIISHLQENPDAMAAVALTLAEISNIASKMAPGALTALKGTAPAVLALLASPEFLVAVGVGLGVTIVMFGGYKIIKKIKARADGTAEATDGAPRHVDLANGGELLDVKELDRIENWRRGIADTGVDETGSIISGTTVEGEFITPFAAQSMGHLPLRDKGRKKHHGSDSNSRSKDKESKKKKKSSSSSSRRDRDGASDTGSSKSRSDSSARRASTGKELVKTSKPSPLRRMFTVNA